MNITNDEYWDLFDINRMIKLKHHRRGDVIPDGLYHLVVHSWIMDKSGMFLVSQRQKRRSYALKWERTGGSVLEGESSLSGAIREVKEELGIDLSGEISYFIKSEKRDKYHDFFDSWLFIVDKEKMHCVIDESEVKDYKWMTIDDLDSLRKRGEIVPSSLYYKEVYNFFENINC